MNCTLTRATSTELDICGVHANLPPATFSESNAYATAPMAAILPPYQLPCEEELHTSFEEAISARVSALQERLSRYSHPALPIQDAYNIHQANRAQSTSHEPASSQPRHLSGSWSRIQLCAALAGLALFFTLVGFDLMGLLVLHMR